MPHGKKFTKVEFETIKFMHSKGYTGGQIAKMLNRSAHGVNNIIKFENYNRYEDSYRHRVIKIQEAKAKKKAAKKLSPVETEIAEFLRKKGVPEKNIADLTKPKTISVVKKQVVEKPVYLAPAKEEVIKEEKHYFKQDIKALIATAIGAIVIFALGMGFALFIATALNSAH